MSGLLLDLDARFDSVLEGVSELGLSSVWFVPDSPSIGAEVAEEVMAAFPDRLVVCWQTSSGKGRSPRVREAMRVFGDDNKRAERVVARSTLQFPTRAFTHLALIAAVVNLDRRWRIRESRWPTDVDFVTETAIANEAFVRPRSTIIQVG